MLKLSYFINRLANGLNAAAKQFLIITGIAISIVVFLQVAFRFTIKIPFPWSEESARYLMIWMGMVGSAVALRQARHIGVTILIERLPAWTLRILVPIVEFMMILFLSVTVREGFRLALKNFSQLSPAMNIPMFFPYLAVPVGATLMILELTAAMLHEFYPTEAGEQRQLSTTAL